MTRGNPTTAVAILLLTTVALAGCTQASADPDGDGLPTSLEETIGTDPENPDTDGDGLTDREETQGPPKGYAHLGVDALTADTDGDGLNDFEEVVKWGTDPAAGDGDRDGLPDSDEVDLGDWSCAGEGAKVPRCDLLAGPDPTVSDTDSDHWPDGREAAFWTGLDLDRVDVQDFLNTPDVDGDGFLDGRDGDPLFNISIRVELVKTNLTRSFDGGPANVTAEIRVAGNRRSVHLGDVPQGETRLDVQRLFDVDDGPRPPGDFRVSTALTLVHVDDSGDRTAIVVDGNATSVVAPFDAGDPEQRSIRHETSGVHGSLTYRLRACTNGC